MAHTFNPSTQEAEAGGSLWVRGQPGLQDLVPEHAPKLQRNPVSKRKKKTPNSYTHIDTYMLPHKHVHMYTNVNTHTQPILMGVFWIWGHWVKTYHRLHYAGGSLNLGWATQRQSLLHITLLPQTTGKICWWFNDIIHIKEFPPLRRALRRRVGRDGTAH